MVNTLFATALATSNVAARNRIGSRIDRQVMSDAVSCTHLRQITAYRNPHLTNVHVGRIYAMYDYANLGYK